MMKRKNAVVRILAVLLTVIMVASLSACVNSYNNNPTVAKVGNQKLGINQYATLFNNSDTSSNIYYAYLQYGMINLEQYADYILDDLVNYGVQLDQVEVQGITLDSEEEAKLQQDVDDKIKEYCNTNYADKIDSAITDEAAKYEAELELLKADLKNAKTNFDTYRKSVEDSLRQNALLTKLREINVADVSASKEDIAKYFEENAKTDVTMANFRTNFSNYFNGDSEAIPFVIPHPERAVEDDPETTDKDEAQEANPYGEIFSVLHLLLMFKEAAGDDVTDLAAYAADDEEFLKKVEDFEATIPGLTKEQFLQNCFDKDLCEDPGMQQKAYQYFGYMMQESIIDSYYPGFGYASMKLKYGDAWTPKAAETDSADTTAEEPKEYEVTMFDLADGTKIAKVLTKAGAHYIILNENDWAAMYDDDGFLMVPVYENDELVTDGEGVVTLTGHMTQAQLDAMNEILSHVGPTEEEPDETEQKEDAEEPEDTEDTEDTEEDAKEPITAKTIFEYCRKAKQAAMETEAFNTKFKEWKENTKITVHKNLIKSFYKG